MSSASKKRREATTSLETDSTNGDTIEGVETQAKRPCLSPESAVKMESKAPTNDFDDTVVNRTPLKVALKRLGKRDHELLESPSKSAADEAVAEQSSQEAGPPPRKVARASPAVQSPSSSRSAPMASNLRTSLRGSAGSTGQKQVKKLVVKSTLGTLRHNPQKIVLRCWALVKEALLLRSRPLQLDPSFSPLFPALAPSLSNLLLPSSRGAQNP